MQTFGEQLVAARKAKGMTQEAFSQAINVTRQTVSSWERGRTVPDINMVRRLSELLGVRFTQAQEEWSAVASVEQERPAPVEEEQPAPVAEDAPTEGPTAAEPPTADVRRRIGKWKLIAGIAMLACAVLLCLLLFPPQAHVRGRRRV